jgi:hypothetical protein
MAAHTPGPWKAYAYLNGAFDIESESPYAGASNYLVISSRNQHHSRDDEMHANAKLIAAAPDLLAVCRFFLDGIDGGHIKCAPYIDFDPNATQLEIRSPAERLRAAIEKATK